MQPGLPYQKFALIYGRFNITYNRPKLWNELDERLKSLSPNVFKNELTLYFINLYYNLELFDKLLLLCLESVEEYSEGKIQLLRLNITSLAPSRNAVFNHQTGMDFVTEISFCKAPVVMKKGWFLEVENFRVS